LLLFFLRFKLEIWGQKVYIYKINNNIHKVIHNILKLIGEIMRLKRVNIIIFLILILFSILFTQNLNANPLPSKIVEVEEGGNVIPDSETPVILKSEEILFQINGEVLITANFTLYNPTNSTIYQLIIFPFNSYRYEIGTQFEAGHFSYSIINLSLNQNGSRIPYMNTSYDDNRAISFKISIPPYDEKTIHLKYKTKYGLLDDDTCILKYTTTTGKAWNQSIGYAYFKFIFNISCNGIPSGGDEVIMGRGHIITTIEKHNWNPSEDISIIWIHYDYEKYSDKNKDPEIYEEKKDRDRGDIFIPSFTFIVLIYAFGISMIIIYKNKKIL